MWKMQGGNLEGEVSQLDYPVDRVTEVGDLASQLGYLMKQGK
jgi:hypothetical protein